MGFLLRDTIPSVSLRPVECLIRFLQDLLGVRSLTARVGEPDAYGDREPLGLPLLLGLRSVRLLTGPVPGTQGEAGVFDRLSNRLGVRKCIRTQVFGGS